MDKMEMPKGFNWLTVLTKLSNGEMITEGRHCKLQNMAGNWPTCACGQLCKELPRMTEGAPIDAKLRHMGIKFAQYVEERKWCKALLTFQKIEIRTQDLLDEREEEKKQLSCPSSVLV